MPEIGISDERLMELLGGKGEESAGDPDRARRAKASTQANKALKLQKDSMALKIKEIQLQKQKIQLEMLQKRSAAQVSSGGGSLIAGVAAGTILAKVIMKMVGESMIMNKSLSFLNRLMGLLVDFILLPFLPVIVDALIGLSNTILDFGEAWDKAVSGGNFLEMIGLISDLPRQLIEGLTEALGFNIGRWIGENFTDAPLQAIANMVSSFKDGIIDLWNSWVQFCYDAKDYIFDTLLGGWKSALDGMLTAISNMVNSIPGIKEGKAIAKGVESFAGGNSVGSVIVQVSGTVFKDEVDLFNTIASRLRSELFRWMPSGG